MQIGETDCIRYTNSLGFISESKVFLIFLQFISDSQGWVLAFSPVMKYMTPWNLGTCANLYLGGNITKICIVLPYRR